MHNLNQNLKQRILNLNYMIKNLDDSVGEIKRTLEGEGILDNTLMKKLI